MNNDSNEETLAQACSEAMQQKDNCSHAFDIAVVDAGPGCAQLSMIVREDMINGHGTCHGGIIFTLADTAFAHACNNRNHISVAVSCQIEFLVPVSLGETLTATAVEQHLKGRNGVYDVTVDLSDGTRAALFRGKSRAVGGTLIDSLTIEKS